MKKMALLQFVFFTVLSTCVMADDVSNNLTSIKDDTSYHIFGVTGFDLSKTSQNLSLELPDINNGKNLLDSQSNNLFWRIISVSKCNPETGTKIATVSCFERLVNGKIQVTDESKCDLNTKPESVIACSAGVERYYWKKVYTSTCSSACGSGQRSFEFDCTQRLVSGQMVIKDKSECNVLLGEMPGGLESCTDNSGCNYHWESSPWSECSLSCIGPRTQTRVNTCVDHDGQVVLDSGLCSSPEPISTQGCQNDCILPLSCGEVLVLNPAAQDGYYELNKDGVATSMYCDMENGGFTYLGQFTLKARTYSKFTSWFPFKEIKAKPLSGKITCATDNHCAPSSAAIATYGPSRSVTRLSTLNTTYAHIRDVDQTYFQYGDWERLSGYSSYTDNGGSAIVDIYIK